MNKFIQFMRLFGLLLLFTIAVIMVCFGYQMLLDWLKTIWPKWGVTLFIVLSMTLGASAIIWIDEKW